jgi:hypothetical protein
MKTDSQLYLCHYCCNSGVKKAIEWLMANGYPTQFTRKNLFQVKHEKLDQKYGFSLDSLTKHSYLCDGEKVLVVLWMS